MEAIIKAGTITPKYDTFLTLICFIIFHYKKPKLNNDIIYQIVQFLRSFFPSRALVAHTCNPVYSGGRDQEDHSLKPARANSSWDPI
jgi:hypothetical protein